MMNQAMKPQMQPQMGGAGGTDLSEEELKKLAMLLQQMPQGEGLATVTPMEEDQMKDAGGAGTPLPGTQGLGPAGGPVKSFSKKDDGRVDADHRIAILTDAEVEALNYLKHQDKDQGYPTGNGPLIQALASMNTHDLDYHTVKGMRIPSLNDFSDGGYGSGSDAGSSAGESEGGAAASGGYGYGGGGGDGGGGDGGAAERERQKKMREQEEKNKREAGS